MSNAEREQARACAHIALERLDALARGDDSGRIFPEPHRHFAALYSQVTRNWLREVNNWDDPWTLHLTIAHFYERYAACVLPFVRDGNRKPPWHWRAYFKLAERAKSDPRMTGRMLSFGVLAHTGPDLSDAIALTLGDIRKKSLSKDALEQFRREILGRHSAHLFFGALLHYSIKFAGNKAGKLHLPIPAHIRLLRPFWLPAFLFYRHFIWTSTHLRIFAHRTKRFRVNGPVKPLPADILLPVSSRAA